MAAKICPACRTRNDDDVRYCQWCALRLRPAYLPPRRRARAAGVVLALAVPVLIGVVTLVLPGRPQAVISYEPPGSAGPSPFVASGPFGGTSVEACDVELLVRALQARREQLGAWGAVLDIGAAAVPAYIRSLRPGVLETDTRVTNHSYRDGRAVPHQSVLPRGTAVLVDAEDRIVTRCRCGNPLLPPLPTTGLCSGCPRGYRLPAAGDPARIRTADTTVLGPAGARAGAAWVYDLHTTGVEGGCTAPDRSSMTIWTFEGTASVAASDGSRGTGPLSATGEFRIPVAGPSGGGELEGRLAGDRVDGSLDAAGCVVRFTGTRRW